MSKAPTGWATTKNWKRARELVDRDVAKSVQRVATELDKRDRQLREALNATVFFSYEREELQSG